MTLELHIPDFISSYSTLTLTFQLAGPQPSLGDSVLTSLFTSLPNYFSMTESSERVQVWAVSRTLLSQMVFRKHLFHVSQRWDSLAAVWACLWWPGQSHEERMPTRTSRVLAGSISHSSGLPCPTHLPRCTDPLIILTYNTFSLVFLPLQRIIFKQGLALDLVKPKRKLRQWKCFSLQNVASSVHSRIS